MAEQEISHIIQRALPHMSELEVKRIVDYLKSNNVGVTSVADLRDVTAAMLDGKLPPLKAMQLTRAFSQLPENAAGQLASSITEPEPTSVAASSSVGALAASTSGGAHGAQPDYEISSTFVYRVPWPKLPNTNLSNLAQAELQGKMAGSQDVQAIKLAIVKDVIAKYILFKEDHPGSKKHPGRKIYNDITDQVFARFPNCIRDSVNGKVIGDGKTTFRRHLEISLENKLRGCNTSSNNRTKVVRSNQIVGVLKEQYLPATNEESITEMKSIRDYLLSLHQIGPHTWTWDEIQQHLKKTYQLQRIDIVEAIDKVVAQQAKSQEEDGKQSSREEEADEPQEELRALRDLKKLWPFLFTPTGLAIHHMRLTSRNLPPFLKDFLAKKLDYLLLYMASNSATNTNNLILRLRVDFMYPEEVPLSAKLLTAVSMLANHFGEDLGSLIKTVEKTTQPDEVEWKDILDEKVAIIALDNEMLKAEKFLICADNTMLLECNGFDEAITSLILACFTLDLDYPTLPYVFEFLERYIYGMGFLDTRVKRKGKLLVVLSDKVKALISDFDAFSKKLAEALTPDMM